MGIVTRHPVNHASHDRDTTQNNQVEQNAQPDTGCQVKLHILPLAQIPAQLSCTDKGADHRDRRHQQNMVGVVVRNALILLLDMTHFLVRMRQKSPDMVHTVTPLMRWAAR